MEFDHHKHCVGGSNYHLQFTPKYRRPMFFNRHVRELCRALFRKKAKELGIRLETVEFGPDHVHLFVTNCRKYSVAELAFHFKGSSSRYIRQKAWKYVKRKLWGRSFWSDGYFFESVGRVTSDSIKFYIERQQGKHWTGIDYDYPHERSVRDTAKQTTIEQFAS